jgi:hypothetical protein
MREDNFFAEPIVESKGRKPAPADTTLTIQSQNGTINVPVSRDEAVENFPISTELLAENPLVIANKPKGSLTWHCKSESQSRIRRNSDNRN